MIRRWQSCMVVTTASVKTSIVIGIHLTDVCIVDDGDAEKPIWDNDINIDDIDPPTNTKSKAEQKKQKKKEKKRNKKADEDVGVDMDDMDADLDAGAGWDEWDDDEEEWRGTEEERKRKVDAYMDEVVNRLGFSGIVSLLNLQTDRVSHAIFADLPHAYAFSLHFYGCRKLRSHARRNPACDGCRVELLCWAQEDGALSCRQRLVPHLDPFI